MKKTILKLLAMGLLLTTVVGIIAHDNLNPSADPGDIKPKAIKPFEEA